MRMDKNRYRGAVSGIRWTDEQRGKIEEKLRQPAEKPSGAAFEDADFEAYEPPMTTEERRRTEEEMAKQERKIRRMGRMGWAVAAAILLVLGTAFTALIVHTKKLREDSNALSGKLGLHLTDQKASPTRGFFSKSESGFYIMYNYYKYEMGKSSIYGDDGKIVKVDAYQQLPGGSLPTYYDAETGESAVLCARPNCTHDGSTYCTATTKIYSSFSGNFDAIYADGYLYKVATKYDQSESRIQITQDGDLLVDKSHDHAVLLRYEPDGTGITELHDFGVGCGASRPVMHRGYLWFSVQTKTYGEPVKNQISGADEVFVNGGYEIWGYELKTGNLVKIYDSEPKPDLNHVDTAPQYLAGIGDYIYFNTEEGDWAAPTGTNKINLLTGEMTQAPEFSIDNGYNDHYGLYYYVASVKDSNETPGWRIVNIETGEMKALEKTENSIYYYGTPFLSGDYIFWSQENHQENQEGQTTFRIYDLNGEVLLDRDITELYIPEYPSEWKDFLSTYIMVVDFSDGKIYLQMNIALNDEASGLWWEMNTSVYSASVEDLIAGNPQWKKEFERMDSEEAKEQLSAYKERLKAEERSSSNAE